MGFKKTLIQSGVAMFALLAASGVASATPTVTVTDVTAQGTLTPLSPAAGTFPLLALGSTGSAGQHGVVTTSDFSVGGVSIDFQGGSGTGTTSGEYYGTNETPYASPFGGNSNNNFLVAGAENGGGQHPGIVTLTFNTAQTTLNILWGTIDFDPTSQNVVTINTSSGPYVITGVDLEGKISGLQNGQSDAYVSITGLDPFTTVSFADNSSTNAFEFMPGAEVTTPVPEPLTLSLFGAGLAGAAAIRRKKAKKA
jgi:PEP-CTERM motif